MYNSDSWQFGPLKITNSVWQNVSLIFPRLIPDLSVIPWLLQTSRHPADPRCHCIPDNKSCHTVTAAAAATTLNQFNRLDKKRCDSSLLYSSWPAGLHHSVAAAARPESSRILIHHGHVVIINSISSRRAVSPQAWADLSQGRQVQRLGIRVP